MKNLDLFIKTNVLLNKLIACLVFFCLVMTSTSLVNNFSQQCMVVDETIQASADTILVQFFYISTLPANLISKLFLNGQIDPITNTKNSEKNKNNATESNSAKASVGFSILPAQLNISKVLETGYFKVSKHIVAVETIVNSFTKYVSSCLCFCKGVISTNIIMMLLLSIIISRRKVSDDNIIFINIKNNYLAQLI